MLHLAGDYGESEKAATRFAQAFPKSTLLPAVLFRNAENAYFTLQAAQKNPNLNPQDKAKEVARWQDESMKRYQLVIDKYPEFPHVHLARNAVGLILYAKGDLEKARNGGAVTAESESDKVLNTMILALLAFIAGRVTAESTKRWPRRALPPRC